MRSYKTSGLRSWVTGGTGGKQTIEERRRMTSIVSVDTEIVNLTNDLKSVLVFVRQDQDSRFLRKCGPEVLSAKKDLRSKIVYVRQK